MAKISELTDKQLSTNLAKYKELVITDSTNERNNKVFQAIKKEIAIRATTTVPKTKSKVTKYHSDEVDYQSYPQATFKARAVALIIDGIFIGIASQIFTAIITMLFKSKDTNLMIASMFLGVLGPFLIIPFVYYIIPLNKSGQTLGKKFLKIKVIPLVGNEQLSIKVCMKREFLGKFLSSIVFMVGYLIYLAGKPTWHDSIAKTKVISID
jgi:uncharacterized RDD family membrane protein YckC